MGCNQNWGELLEKVEKTKDPITYQALSTLQYEAKGMKVDLQWVTRCLWNFLGNHMDDSLYRRRLQLASGEEGNGLEIWRVLFRENEGGAKQVVLSGIRTLHNFPRCPKTDELQAYIGEWLMARQRFGGDMPDVPPQNHVLQHAPRRGARGYQEEGGHQHTSRT